MQRNNLNEIYNVFEWKKNGDFGRTFDGGDRNRVVEYSDRTHPFIPCVIISGYKNGYIGITWNCYKLLNNLITRCKEDKLTITIDDNSASLLFAPSQSRKPLLHFLNCIDSITPLGNEIKNEIVSMFSWRNLKHIPKDEKSFHEELERLLDDDNLNEVIIKANLAENDDLFWRLGKYCENKQRFHDAITLYQEITKDNPHYQEANHQAAYILMLYSTSFDGSASLLDTEKRKLQEDKFRFLLRSGNQTTIDHFYYQLCDGNGLNPTIQNIACNEDTLIVLSKQISSLKKENNDLQKRNEELMKEIFVLNAQPEKSNNSKIYQNTLFNSHEKKKSKQPTTCGFIPII